MAQLRPGSRVPNRKQLPNLWTITGYPQWGTYAALGMNSVNTEIQIGKRKAGTHVGTGGGRKRKHLDPRNLCHRIRPNELHVHKMRAVYERAMKLCLELDRLDPEQTPNLYERASINWVSCMQTLVDHKCIVKLGALILAEAHRGQVRCKLYVTRAGLIHLIH